MTCQFLVCVYRLSERGWPCMAATAHAAAVYCPRAGVCVCACVRVCVNLTSRCLYCHSRKREAAELAERRKIEETAQQLAATQAEITSLRSELMAVKAEAAREKRAPAEAPTGSTDGGLDAASITCVHRAT